MYEELKNYTIQKQIEYNELKAYIVKFENLYFI